MQDLAFVYGVHSSTISRVFHNVINVLYAKLVPMMIRWPDRYVLDNDRQYQCAFKKKEIFIEKPTDLKSRAQTYSNCKSHNTAK